MGWRISAWFLQQNQECGSLCGIGCGSFPSWIVQSQLWRSFICVYSCCQPKAT